MEKRFIDNGDGTVTDHEMKIMWKQTDGFQDSGEFTNWYQSKEYLRLLNLEEFASFSDWKLPSLEEAQSLYVPESHIRDMDRFEIYIDPSFSPGGSYSLWTGDERPFENAVIFYYRYGYEDLAQRFGAYNKCSVRAVRSIE
tara:strand:- start:185 stop:607 length:423 start_codon:yes stop_codon:yes gene_type:complete